MATNVCIYKSCTSLILSRPRSRANQTVPDTEEDLHAENKGASGDDMAGDPSGDSVASGSSGFGSLPRKDPSAKVSTGYYSLMFTLLSLWSKGW